MLLIATAALSVPAPGAPVSAASGSSALVSTAPAAAPAAPAHTLAFRLVRGIILLTARLGEAEGTFILDTGSSASTLDRGLADRLALPRRPLPGAVRGTGEMPIETASAAAIQIGSLTLRDEPLVVVPLTEVSEAHGAPIGGTLGHPFFARYVVEIDYARQELRLFEPQSYAYRGSGTALPIDLAKRIPIVAARLTPRGGPPFDARLVLDLGTGGIGLVLTAPCTAAHAAALAPSGPPRELGRGVGGAASGWLGRLAAVDAGALHVIAPTVAMARDASGFLGVTWADGTLGAPVFERTTMIVDYARARIIFEPGPRFAEPFPADGSGLDLMAAAPAFAAVTVRSVLPGSPAAAAGITPGDTLIAIDEQAVAGLDLAAALDLLEGHDVERRLTLLRGGSRIEVRLRLRRLV